MTMNSPAVTLDLVDHDGRAFTEQALGGTVSLVYFGFLNCRVVCPRTLAKIAQVLKVLGPYAARLKVYYISVDPERDTPEAMRAHLAINYPWATGLTGSREQVDLAKAQFRVFAQRRDDEAEPDGYSVPHTAFIYLVDSQSRIAAHFPDMHMADDIARKVLEGGWLIDPALAHQDDRRTL